jgi:hypothetical protein
MLFAGRVSSSHGAPKKPSLGAFHTPSPTRDGRLNWPAAVRARRNVEVDISSQIPGGRPSPILIPGGTVARLAAKFVSYSFVITPESRLEGANASGDHLVDAGKNNDHLRRAQATQCDAREAHSGEEYCITKASPRGTSVTHAAITWTRVKIRVNALALYYFSRGYA